MKYEITIVGKGKGRERDGVSARDALRQAYLREIDFKTLTVVSAEPHCTIFAGTLNQKPVTIVVKPL